MTQKLMSWLSLALLIAGLVTIAMGLGALIGEAVEGSTNIVPVLLRMVAGISLWVLGVRIAQHAADRGISMQIDLPSAAVTNLADARRLRARLASSEAGAIPQAA